MSESNADLLGEVNRGLYLAAERGEPFEVDFRGRPELWIRNLDPLEYKRYGRVFNTAPFLVGRFALLSFMFREHPSGQDLVQIYAAIRGGEAFYGVGVRDPRIVEDASEFVGVPLSTTI